MNISIKMRLSLMAFLISLVSCQKNANFASGRSTIVHLFEWKWTDIADECERFLKDKEFGGVQISPPNENLIVTGSNRPWWERYQPVSYIINTRSGDENAFADMVKRCNDVGVRIYVDAVINHMTGMSGTGTTGSSADRDDKNYPGVPYSINDFHESSTVNNYQDAWNVRNCELGELADLDQSSDYVRRQIINYMNRLVSLGVAGFRIDAAKHMWPEDLQAIYSGLQNLNSDVFGDNARPYIYQEVIDLGGEAISKHEYTDIGNVLEFQFGVSLGNAFQGGNQLANLANWGPDWNLLDGPDAVAFIDNHDNQRTGGSQILTYKNPKPYKMAIAFMLAHPYGTTRIMSSFAFDNNDQGPPQDGDGNLISPSINDDGTCGNGYVCEHRWRQIFNMVGFRNAVEGTQIANWWSNNDQQIAFGRGDKGFIAFTNGGDLNEHLNTGLPAGTYCDVISGGLENGLCTGKTVNVGDDGYADISLGIDEYDGVLAIHVNAKVVTVQNFFCVFSCLLVLFTVEFFHEEMAPPVTLKFQKFKAFKRSAIVPENFKFVFLKKFRLYEKIIAICYMLLKSTTISWYDNYLFPFCFPIITQAFQIFHLSPFESENPFDWFVASLIYVDCSLTLF